MEAAKSVANYDDIVAPIGINDAALKAAVVDHTTWEDL
jgi:hypothetical protein